MGLPLHVCAQCGRHCPCTSVPRTTSVRSPPHPPPLPSNLEQGGGAAGAGPVRTVWSGYRARPPREGRYRSIPEYKRLTMSQTLHHLRLWAPPPLLPAISYILAASAASDGQEIRLTFLTLPSRSRSFFFFLYNLCSFSTIPPTCPPTCPWDH